MCVFFTFKYVMSKELCLALYSRSIQLTRKLVNQLEGNLCQVAFQQKKVAETINRNFIFAFLFNVSKANR